ncbi:2-oxo-4-hydroxy-4-carboxy-5-ureidoimidazoline decarboxylase [Spirulina sp. CCNP1310]|uniref:2-oxo-4-hydroxy-4-carboxy-5-ureidoimidazoline decarboxylase n=1 Tax=Spirulina sp. CCNP1310 TaxID=3110249 RepID=UPI002B218A37|nr:2-oxo-4-hydroxy-4-carboxy-5-ureidoimidazoline decarboxylase [Spirulina sp. CCNP1310]MEA5420367.1 2-oxo-4-hydroxy-4-carboxy-5-ureidoimidazoline decarboxylase [Spirulina sp. CCNP1310]
MAQIYTLQRLNQLDQSAFTVVLGDIFEETPGIAAQAWFARPFGTIGDLHGAMVGVVRSLPLAEQLALIQAHPDLGSRAQMATASVQEQAGAGLNQLSEGDYQRLLSLNEAYQARFGFPFIIAVRNHTQASIFATMEERLENDLDQERERALAEIFEIARWRLGDRITS